ncbi:MAG: ATP-binding protein [Desulfuromusa sp.]|nr:ATP-binding protein [Desulfuromusa sp.]
MSLLVVFTYAYFFETVRESTQKKLSDKNTELQKEISVRTCAQEDLKNAKEVAETANRTKSEFLANMSHELRTPLNHIIGFTELVVDKNFGELNEVQQEYLEDVLHSSGHLLSLINDVLDLSKVEAGKLELERSDVNFKLLLENSLVMVKEKTLKHGIQMATDLDGVTETVRADKRKLKQILYNLLSNAVKCTPDGGEMCLTGRMVDCNVGSGLRRGDRADLPSIEHRYDRSEAADDRWKKCVEVSVSDTGIGLKSEDLKSIFDPFEQVESSANQRYQSTGLGLSLTRRLVELHGGRIWAESEGEGKGSRFSFIIPA